MRVFSDSQQILISYRALLEKQLVLVQGGNARRSRTPSTREHTKSIAIFGTISSEKNLQPGRLTPSPNETETTPKQVGKAETQFHHKPHPQCKNLRLRENSKPGASP